MVEAIHVIPREQATRRSVKPVLYERPHSLINTVPRGATAVPAIERRLALFDIRSMTGNSPGIADGNKDTQGRDPSYGERVGEEPVNVPPLIPPYDSAETIEMSEPSRHLPLAIAITDRNVEEARRDKIAVSGFDYEPVRSLERKLKIAQTLFILQHLEQPDEEINIRDLSEAVFDGTNNIIVSMVSGATGTAYEAARSFTVEGIGAALTKFITKEAEFRVLSNYINRIKNAAERLVDAANGVEGADGLTVIDFYRNEELHNAAFREAYGSVLGYFEAEEALFETDYSTIIEERIDELPSFAIGEDVEGTRAKSVSLMQEQVAVRARRIWTQEEIRALPPKFHEWFPSSGKK